MTNSLTPKNNLENELVQQLRDILVRIKHDYILSSTIVYRIYEAWTGTADEWVDFYTQQLDLSKSQVSKMRKVGGFVLAHSLLKATEKQPVGYEALYLSINRNPDADPKYVLAEAATWSPSDYRDAKKEDGHEHHYELFCSICYKKPDGKDHL